MYPGRTREKDARRMSAHPNESKTLSRPSDEMPGTNFNTCGYGPAIDWMAEGKVRVRASYLASRWVQAPITDWREADT